MDEVTGGDIGDIPLTPAERERGQVAMVTATGTVRETPQTASTQIFNCPNNFFNFSTV